MKRVVVLGSTGSIGVQALEVIEAAGEDLQLVGISAQTSWEQAVAQADKHGVERIAIADPAEAERCAAERSGVLAGPEGVRELVATSEADLVLNAITGSAGPWADDRRAHRGHRPGAREQGEPGRSAAS